MRAIGIAIPFFRRRSGVPIDAQAQVHYNRVIADGGVVPSGLSGVNAFFTAIKAIYGTSDITTAISAAYDPHYLGYKLGAGSGTTLGQAAQKLYSCSGASGDVVQTTAASQPLLLAHTGENYWWGSGVAGNGCITASSYTFPTNSGLTIEADILIDTATARTIIAKDSGSGAGRCLFLGWNGSNFYLSFGSNFAYNAICSVATAIGYNGWVRVNATTVGSNMEVKFFTSNDGINYTQLGTTIVVAGAANSIQTTSTTYQIGGNTSALANPWSGRIRRTRVYDANNTLLVDFNPASYNPATSQTQWSSATGEVWSISTGTAATGYKGVLVDRTYTQTDGIDDGLINTLSGSGIKTQYFTHKAFSGGSMPLGLWNTSTFSQAFYYPSSTLYGFYQGGAQDGPFGVNVIATPRLRISGAVGGTGTDWIPFQNGVDVSNGGANIGSVNTFNSLRIGVRGNNTGYSNGQYTSYIVTNQGDNATQRTAIQTYLNSITKCY